MSTDIVTKPNAGMQLANARADAVQQSIAKVDGLDWRQLKPPVLAELIHYSKGLTPIESLVFAIRAYELGVSPFSNECWFNTQTKSINLTLEGKKKVARNMGYNLGAPKFSRETRAWPNPIKIQGLTEDIGITCTISVEVTGGLRENTSYTAWLSEWYMPTNPNWKSRPEHMLQVRSFEKAISFSTGVGSSEQPGDADIASSKLEDTPSVAPTITVNEVEYVEEKKQ
jgi:hypothetical protein